MKTIKCVIWDLDNTVWDGTLLEGDALQLRDGVHDALRTLDERGILNAISSRNDEAAALEALESFGLRDLFVAQRISWGPKSTAVTEIAAELNIGIDTLAFIDDQEFERDEVANGVPEVACFDAGSISTMLDDERMIPRFVTNESRERRGMYRAEAGRTSAERDFEGTSSQFLADLGLVMTIRPAQESDLQRAEELTQRTNQLNATGYTYSYEELDALRLSSEHELLVATLEDRYGSYGTIGLCLLEVGAEPWRLRLLLMSCRVMSRGVGNVMLQHAVSRASAAGARLRADFVPTDRNRAMFVTYKFGGFSQVGDRDGVLELEHDGSEAVIPDYLQLDVIEAARV